MAKVEIRHDFGGWIFVPVGCPDHEIGKRRSSTFSSYPQVVRGAKEAGHEINNAGWLRRMLMWNFNSHSLDGFPEWEIERDRAPAFAKLAHVRQDGKVESHKLAEDWDDVAAADFYQRDWTSDSLPTVRKGEVYWSGWWFATIAERDRFLAWAKERGCEVAS